MWIDILRVFVSKLSADVFLFVWTSGKRTFMQVMGLKKFMLLSWRNLRFKKTFPTNYDIATPSCILLYYIFLYQVNENVLHLLQIYESILSFNFVLSSSFVEEEKVFEYFKSRSILYFQIICSLIS